jgi:hypothetical protein
MAYLVTINRHFPMSENRMDKHGAPLHSTSFATEARTIREALALITVAQIAYCGERLDSWGESDVRRLRSPGQEMSFRDSRSGLFLTIARARETVSQFYADLNPNFGARGESRYGVFDRKTKWLVSRDIAPQYQTLRAAEKCARLLNHQETQCNT